MNNEELTAKNAKGAKEDLTAKNAKSAKEELLFKDECYAIQGAVFDVYREMGCGFL